MSKLPSFLQKSELGEIFAHNKVSRAYLFGSAIRSEFNEHSDIDFLITFQDGLTPLEKGNLWWNLHDTLRDLYQREIDIVTENSLKNPFFIRELDRTKILIYG